jgi:hypothetical protein
LTCATNDVSAALGLGWVMTAMSPAANVMLSANVTPAGQPDQHLLGVGVVGGAEPADAGGGAHVLGSPQAFGAPLL